ncbi:hypothetical protein E3N88_10595 [Mikania micrantha]|uniref:Uncharacterized protein n=1 Tax=Mikania micrantha TaxID=192012 RepID=A0A5N6PD23_9ASTR|nr:hypothetical protein E3N88_10595 [Mikania micrantha]
MTQTTNPVHPPPFQTYTRLNRNRPNIWVDKPHPSPPSPPPPPPPPPPKRTMTTRSMTGNSKPRIPLNLHTSVDIAPIPHYLDADVSSSRGIQETRVEEKRLMNTGLLH